MSICTPDACWEVRARDRNVMLYFEQLQVFQQIGDELVLRWAGESEHAVSLVSIAQRPPINKIPACAPATS